MLGPPTADHRLCDISAVHLRLKSNPNAFPGGLPQTRFLVRGRKVFDPRTGLKAFSSNPPLCTLDYLRSPLGLRCPDRLIDFTSFGTAANICDEVLDSIDPHNVVDGVPGKVRRYTLNGVVDLASGRAAIIESFETSCAGKLVFSQGKYRFYAGAFDAPNPLILTSDMLRGSDPTVRNRPSRSVLFNTVRGKYLEPRQDWLETDYAEQQNAQAVLDDGDEIAQPLSYTYTTNGATAQRLAALELAKIRNGRNLNVQCNWGALGYRLWDVINVDLPEVNIAMQPFRLVEATFAEGGGLDLVLKSEEPANYHWDTSMERVVVDVVRPANPNNDPPEPITGLVVSGLPRVEQYGTVPTLSATWDASPDPYFLQFDVQYKRSDDSADESSWIGGGSPKTADFTTQLVEFDVAYDVRVRVILREKFRYSEWVEVDNTLVANDTSAPGLPTDLSVTGTGTHTVHWTTPNDDDFKKSNVYANSTMTDVGAVMVASVVGLQLTAYTATHTPGAPTYYYVSSVDRTGNESALTYAGLGS